MEWNSKTWGFRHPLAVWVVWHPPEDTDGCADETRLFAHSLYQKLGGEWLGYTPPPGDSDDGESDEAPGVENLFAQLPAAEAEIPVFFYPTAHPGAVALEEAIASHHAERVVVLLVVGEEMRRRAARWEPVVERLYALHNTCWDSQSFDLEHRVRRRIPRAFSVALVATQDRDHGIFKVLSKEKPLLWRRDNDLPQLYAQLLRHLCTHFEEGELPRVFLSYTRQDAGRTARTVFNHLSSFAGLAPWMDDSAIWSGDNIRDRIEADLPGSFYLAILSPAFVRGRWTVREAALAQAHDRPMAVLDVLAGTLRRLPPELANAPMLRWPPPRGTQRQPILAALVLSELLRHLVHAARTRMLAEATGHLGALDSCVLPPGRRAAVNGAVRIYADPPLLDEELQYHTRGIQGSYLTAAQYAATAGWPGWLGRPYDLRVGLSASAPDDAKSRGLHDPQLNDLSVRLARTLMCLGLRLVYGGDLRPGGLTMQLVRVAKQYARAGHTAEFLHAFMSWPFWLPMEAQARTEKGKKRVQAFKQSVRFEPIGPPSGMDDVVKHFEWPRGLATVEGRVATSMALTQMRRKLVAACHARVALGGRSTGALGRMPGVVEEVVLSLRAGQPVYLAAGLGGATQVLYRCLKGERPAALTLQRQIDDEPRYAKVNARLPPQARVDWDALQRELGQWGLAGLARLNGLTERENQALADATTATEIIYWVSRGLGRVSSGPDPLLRLRERMDRLAAHPSMRRRS